MLTIHRDLRMRRSELMPSLGVLGIEVDVLRAGAVSESIADAAVQLVRGAEIASEDRAQAGDQLNVECTFENTTDRPQHWGDSALEEMCFINFNLYPALPYGGMPCTR